MSIKETNRVRHLCTWPLRAEKWSQRFWRPRLIQRHLICAHILLQSLTTMRQSLHCVRLVPIPDLTKVLLMMAHWVMRWKLWLWTIVLMSGAVLRFWSIVKRDYEMTNLVEHRVKFIVASRKSITCIQHYDFKDNQCNLCDISFSAKEWFTMFKTVKKLLLFINDNDSHSLALSQMDCLCSESDQSEQFYFLSTREEMIRLCELWTMFAKMFVII